MITVQGTKIPALGFGTWQLSGDNCVNAVKNALDIGYRHIDTAQIYENEAQVGRAIAESELPRNELFVTTKIWMTNVAGEKVAPSVEESLGKLQMDYVDLLLIHWPSEDVPLEETLSAMQELLAKGKTKAIGVSNFTVELMRQAVEIYHAPIICNQIEYHLMLSQRQVLNYTQSHDIMVTAYSPLARGQLTHHPVLTRIGQKYGKTSSQIALRWLIEQEKVAAIPKAATEKNAQLNFEIFDFELDREDYNAITAMTGHNRLVNPGWAPKWDGV